jgi:hypothetical protein
VCHNIKKSSSFSAMDPELQDFAEYLGLRGIDSDLFYESYYELDAEQVESYYEEEVYS